jgi:hypothetical protein
MLMSDGHQYDSEHYLSYQAVHGEIRSRSTFDCSLISIPQGHRTSDLALYTEHLCTVFGIAPAGCFDIC